MTAAATTKCRQCGAAVLWALADGRWRCSNPDGSEHWDACSQRRWQQVKATGTRFETEDSSGYANSIHGTKFDRISAGVFTGKNYRPSGACQQCVPPWEVCADCPDQIERNA